MAAGTIHRIVVHAPRPALKKCAPLLRKLFRYQRGRKLLFKLTNTLFECGVFFLEARDFIFHQSKLGLEQGNVLLEDSHVPNVAESSDQVAEGRE